MEKDKNIYIAYCMSRLKSNVFYEPQSSLYGNWLSQFIIYI